MLLEENSILKKLQNAPEDAVMKFYGGGVEADHKPMIVLVGWFGSNNRYLSKYAQLYSKEHHCNILTVVAPKLCFFVPIYAQFYVSWLNYFSHH